MKGQNFKKPSKAAVSFIGNGLTFVAIVFVIAKSYQQFQEMPAVSLNYASCFGIAISILFNIVCLCLFSAIWRLSLLAIGEKVHWKTAFRVYAASNLAKYIPGNVFQFVGRYSLARIEGISRQSIFISLGLETAIMLGTAALLAIPSAIIFGKWEFLEDVLKRSPILLIILASVSLIGLYFIKYKIPSIVIKAVRLTKLLPITLSSLINLIIWFIYGLSICLVYSLLWPESPGISVYFFAWGFAAAWMAGYLVPGSPGGLGIREAVLYAIFSTTIGGGVAATLFIVMRLNSIAADIGIYLMTIPLKKKVDATRKAKS